MKTGIYYGMLVAAVALLAGLAALSPTPARADTGTAVVAADPGTAPVALAGTPDQDRLRKRTRIRECGGDQNQIRQHKRIRGGACPRPQPNQQLRPDQACDLACDGSQQRIRSRDGSGSGAGAQRRARRGQGAG